MLTAASVDHGLRPEAPEEIALARSLADSLRVPFVALRVDVPAGPSRQALARAVRYQALRACAAERGATRIAVAHTLDDQAETVLARLLRGASVDGLAAIAPRRADGVVRPLIDCHRDAVHAYGRAMAIRSADDPSNRDPRYLRVRVRHRLLPVLCAENPRLPAQLAALADDARAAAGIVAERVDRAVSRAGDGLASLKEEPAFVRRLALKALIASKLQASGDESLGRAHLTALDRMLWIGGQVRVPGDVVASVNEAGQLSLTRVTKRGRGMKRRTNDG